MTRRHLPIAPIALAAAAILLSLGGAGRGHRAAGPTVAVAPDTLRPIAKVDERFLSYNVEMAEVIGGNFWKPYDAQTLAAIKAPKPAPTAAAAAGGTSPQPAGLDTTLFQARPPVDL